jgi:hypothetical protein
MAPHTKTIGMTETWKTIEGFEKYDVSDHGRVRNKTTNRIIKPYDQGGRMSVAFYIDKKTVCRRLHNIVATAFVPNPEQKEYAYHVNFDRMNCRADNLFWISEQERTQLDRQYLNKRAVLDELKALNSPSKVNLFKGKPPIY